MVLTNRMRPGKIGLMFIIICTLLLPENVKTGVVFKAGLENVRKLLNNDGGPIVVYSIDDAVAQSVRDCVDKGLKEISKFSCVKLVDVRTLPQSNDTKIFFRVLPSSSPNDCQWHRASFPLDSINVTLGSICGEQERQCVRALLGSFGMAMEHERPDRDRYITINRSNAHRESIPLLERQLPEKSIEMVTQYDISSIMHFTAQEHSKSDHAVITTNNHFLDESLGGDIRGHRHLLSHRDKETLNYIFKCPKTISRTKSHCLRNGYLDEHGCVCPYGFSGPKCETMSYTSRFNVPTCGTVSDREGDIASPNYPDRYSRGAFCQWLIEGTSPGQRIQFRINDMDLEHENLMPGDRCADKLTIWPHGTDVVTKSLSCLPDETPRYIDKWYNTQYNWLLIEFRTDPWGQHNHRGFNISYKIIDPPTPPPTTPQSKPSIRGGQWSRKAANEKGPFNGSVKTRLLNTIDRQGQLFCYLCDNETQCQREDMKPRPCPAGQACAYRLSPNGEVTWRGCTTINHCLERTKDECQNDDGTGPRRCLQCCGSDLCNISTNEKAAWASSSSAKISQGSTMYKLYLLTFTFSLYWR